MRGTRPEGAETVKKCDAWKIESYSEKRYFTVTEHKLPEAPNEIRDCTAQLQKITDIVWGDDLVGLCRLRSLILSETRENVHIRCPWQAEHTHGGAEKRQRTARQGRRGHRLSLLSRPLRQPHAPGHQEVVRHRNRPRPVAGRPDAER